MLWLILPKSHNTPTLATIFDLPPTTSINVVITQYLMDPINLQYLHNNLFDFKNFLKARFRVVGVGCLHFVMDLWDGCFGFGTFGEGEDFEFGQASLGGIGYGSHLVRGRD